MRPDSITLAIEEHYSPEEKAEIAQQLAGKIADRETTKLEKSASDAAFNERLKAADAENGRHLPTCFTSLTMSLRSLWIRARLPRMPNAQGSSLRPKTV